jgi:hypothetical protein
MCPTFQGRNCRFRAGTVRSRRTPPGATAAGASAPEREHRERGGIGIGNMGSPSQFELPRSMRFHYRGADMRDRGPEADEPRHHTAAPPRRMHVGVPLEFELALVIDRQTAEARSLAG